MKGMLFKSMLRLIRHSLGRFLAIFAIVALGVGFYSGLKVTRDAMVKTGGNYFEEKKLFDFRLISSLGLTEEDLAKIEELPIVSSAAGSVSADLLYISEKGSGSVVHAHLLSDSMNVPEIVAGRMPEAADECVVDSKYNDESSIGGYIELSPDNSEETFDTFEYDKYKIVGVVSSPYYVNFERGASSLGSVSGYIYIPAEGFSVDYYTEIFVRLSERYEVYSDEYQAYADKCEEAITALLEERADIRYESLRNDALDSLQEAEKELNDAKEEYIGKKADTEKKLADNGQKIADGEKELQTAAEELEKGQKALDDALAQLEAGKAYMSAEMYEAQLAGINEQQAGLDEAKKTLEEKHTELERGKIDLEEGRKTADEEFTKAEKEIADAEDEIAEGYGKLEDIEEPSVFVLGRSTNIGYACLENDTGIVSGIAKVFPLFFFIVASLVCITTMTRMVDEQRVQNGVLKALGYSNSAIIGQYLFYAGTASVLGCIIGFLLGSRYMPMVLWKIYHIMYSIDRPIVFLLDWSLFTFCAVLYMIATLGATVLAAYSDLKENAAEMIRPKAPAPGKRILLERIDFIWKKVKFLHKVSIRNILRYKKRMFMMILGVGGCTALLLTGFGIRDSIQPILDYQYGEIHVYDMEVSFKEGLDEEEQEMLAGRHEEDMENICFLHSESFDLVTNDSSDSVTLVVADNLGSDFVNLHKGDEQYSWPAKGEVIIDYRLAKANGISVGDEIEFRNSDLKVLKAKVTGIFDNYIYDYAYVNSESYEEAVGAPASADTAYVNVKEGGDADRLCSDFLAEDKCTMVKQIATQLQAVGNMLSSLDYVVLIVLVCAGALAFIVIYDLTNISINERIREIATIKVLGFHESEAAAYVFRENLVLTFISALVGLPMGVALHRYVMEQIKIKSMYFGHRILPMSFVWSLILTMVFAMIVDVFMYFRLKKVNMAESLKAIE